VDLGLSICRAQASFQATVVPLKHGEHGGFVPLEYLHAFARDVRHHDQGQSGLRAHAATVGVPGPCAVSRIPCETPVAGLPRPLVRRRSGFRL
jgi:hypothetical protein